MPAPRQSAADRFARLEKILTILQAQQEFTLDVVRQSMGDQSPRLLANVVRDLTWSHRRDERWTGYLTVELDPHDNCTAAAHLATPPAPGGTP
ncbi:MAG TPA: hypothetical protein VND64_10425 [Pirellulales bacterium]|nr:hypothetical protein [Pirellulales bacterium]